MAWKHQVVPTAEARCTHPDCHVPATRIISCRCDGTMHRGYTCGNHEADKPGVTLEEMPQAWRSEHFAARLAAKRGSVMRTQFNYLTCYWRLREGRAAAVMHGDADSSVAYLEPVTRAHKSPDGLGLVGYTAHATFRDALADARTFENFENAKGGA